MIEVMSLEDVEEVLNIEKECFGSVEWPCLGCRGRWTYLRSGSLFHVRG